MANMQTEDLSFLAVDATGKLTRQGTLAVGVTGQNARPDQRRQRRRACLPPTKKQGCGGSSALPTPMTARNRAGSATGKAGMTARSGTWAAMRSAGPKISPQNKDISDNWPEWFEGLSTTMNSYSSSCNGELIVAERKTALFPQDAPGGPAEGARRSSCWQKTEAEFHAPSGARI